MCTPPISLITKTEREGLEEALARADALNRDLCDDSKRIIAAARKHLATLPKPPRKVKVTRYGIVLRGEHFESSFGSRTFGSRDDAFAWATKAGGSVVELTGEYEQAAD